MTNLFYFVQIVQTRYSWPLSGLHLKNILASALGTDPRWPSICLNLDDYTDPSWTLTDILTGSSSLLLHTPDTCLCCITCRMLSSGGRARQPARMLKDEISIRVSITQDQKKLHKNLHVLNPNVLEHTENNDEIDN